MLRTERNCFHGYPHPFQMAVLATWVICSKNMPLSRDKKHELPVAPVVTTWHIRS